MGYEAVPNYDSDDGLRFIDIALLPQKKLPCKIAVEADGVTHFLHEDYRLQNAPQHATRFVLLTQQPWLLNCPMSMAGGA